MRKSNSIYNLWKAMRMRCLSPKVKAYDSYGGRGIRICERWDSFENFVADMGPRPEGMTLERKDNDGNYEPANCVWASRTNQANNRRSNRIVEYAGERLTLAELSRKFGIPYGRLYMRLSRGVSIEQAVLKELERPKWFACSDQDALDMQGLVASGISRREVARRFGVSRTVVARAVQEVGAK